MRLPNVPFKYEPNLWQQILGRIQQAFENGHSKGADIEVGAGAGIVFTDENGLRYRYTVDTSGDLVKTAL